MWVWCDFIVILMRFIVFFSVWVTEIRTCVHVPWLLYYICIIKSRIWKKKTLKTDNALSITDNSGSNLHILIFLITGVCLYLAKKKSEPKHVDCNHFRYGCPTSAYRGSTIYNCKIAITLYLRNLLWIVFNLHESILFR